MKYYLIFMRSGRVVYIASFDEEDARLRTYRSVVGKHEVDGVRYDTIQEFNQIA